MLLYIKTWNACVPEWLKYNACYMGSSSSSSGQREGLLAAPGVVKADMKRRARGEHKHPSIEMTYLHIHTYKDLEGLYITIRGRKYAE